MSMNVLNSKFMNERQEKRNIPAHPPVPSSMVSRSSVAIVSAFDELIDLRRARQRASARELLGHCSARSTTARPSATYATPRSSTARAVSEIELNSNS